MDSLQQTLLHRKTEISYITLTDVIGELTFEIVNLENPMNVLHFQVKDNRYPKNTTSSLFYLNYMYNTEIPSELLQY